MKAPLSPRFHRMLARANREQAMEPDKKTFEDEVMERLQRIELLLERLARRLGLRKDLGGRG